MAEVDIIMWSHRKHPIQDLVRNSVTIMTDGDYLYHEMIQPGTCHQNMNRAYHTGSARFVCLLDEDVEILTPSWIWYLIEAMKEDDSIGVMNCAEVKTLAEKIAWVEAADGGLLSTTIRTIPWAPAYVTLYDRERTPWLEFDEEIPGRKGMSDLDASLQIRAHGLRCRRHMGIAVYHPHKGDEEQRLADRTTTKQEELECFPAQQEYMLKKWGQQYVTCVNEAAAMFEQPRKEQPPYYQPSWFKER